MAKNISKNIPKNIFKGLIKYVVGKKDDIRRYFSGDNDKVDKFLLFAKKKKNSVLSM